MLKAVVIGTSYGGLEALKAIIPFLPKDFSLAVIVVLPCSILSMCRISRIYTMTVDKNKR